MSQDAGAATPNLDAEDLFDHAPMGYVITDGDWSIIRANQTLLDWLDLPHEQLLGKHFGELLTPPGRIYHETHYAPLVLHQNHVSEVAADLQRASAPALPVLLGSRARGRGDSRRIRTSLIRVEERRRYEQELLTARRRAEESEARTRALHDAVAQLVGASSETEVTASLHAAGAALPGALDASAWLLDARGEMREMGRARTQPRRLPITADHPAARCFREREVILDDRVNMLAVPLGNLETRGVFAVAMTSLGDATAEDRELLITLAQQAGQALERIAIHERRQQVLQAAAHDLHLPLTIIVGHASSLSELLEDRLSPGEQAAFERLGSVAGRMRDLIGDYLDLARVEEGHVRLELAPTDVGDVLREALGSVKAQAEVEGVNVDLADASGQVLALVDADALRVALTNVVSDAVTLTPRTERVHVTVEASEATIDVSVVDLGVAPSAGGDWVQASASDAPTRSAIGIAVARGFVEAMGGRLVVQEGTHGGTVEIHLPRA